MSNYDLKVRDYKKMSSTPRIWFLLREILYWSGLILDSCSVTSYAFGGI